MPREKRQISENGIYQVYARGIFERQLVRCEDDIKMLISCIGNAKQIYHFDLYAFCICKNEMHLLLKEKSEMELSLIMKLILSSYTSYYNAKYKEKGSLIYDRFKSKPCKTEDVPSVVKYIHQMPAILREYQVVSNYPYSSYLRYFDAKDTLVDKDLFFSAIGGNTPEQKLSHFKVFHMMMEKKAPKMVTRKKVPDELVEEYIVKHCGKTPMEIKKLPQKERKIIIQYLKAKGEITLSQMEKVMHISRTTLSEM